jgi:hypothetical protein
MKEKDMRLLFVTLAICGIVSCASVQPIAPPVVSTSEHKVDKNYELGKSQQVYVGQPLVRVRDYYERQARVQVVRADQAFRMLLPPFIHADVAQGASARVVGTTQRNGKSYRVVVLPDAAAAALRILINDDGSFEGSAISNIGAEMGFNYKPDPPDAKLIGDTATLVDKAKGYINFELVYGGTTSDSIQVLYREYTPDDMARPAFSQQLVYSLASKHIRFRDIQIDVATADNERIAYTVVADGLAATQH